MHSRLMSWSRWLYLAGMVLALVLVIPATWFPFQLGKVAAFALLLLPAIILFTAGGGVRELMRTHGVRLAFLVGLIPLTYLLSWAFSQNKAVGMLGFGVETDTVIFTVLAFLAFMLSFTLFKTLRTAHVLTRTVFWGLVVAAGFQLLIIMLGVGLLPEIFSDRSVNLIGKWNDFGLLLGLLTLVTLAMLELGNLTAARMGSMIALFVGLVVMLLFVNFALVWALVLVFALALAVLKFISQKSPRGSPEDPYAGPGLGTKIPWYALGAGVVAVIALFFGASINTAITSVVPVSSLEVRPAYSSTLEVITASQDRGSDFIIGSGPNTFGDAWLMHKPAEINQTPFWSLDFNVGYSTLVTAFGSVGLLGVIAWLIPLFLVLAALIRAVRLGVLSRDERVAATTVGVAALFLMAAIVLYVPSQNIILLALTLCGAAFGFLWRQGRSNVDVPSKPTRFGGVMAGVFALVLMLLSLWTAVGIGRRMISTAIVQSAAVALAAGDIDTALARADRARGFEQTPDTLRAFVAANTIKLEQIAQTEATPQNTTALQNEFTARVQTSVDAGQALIALAPSDYRSHLSLARIYDLLAAVNIQGALESARTAYQAAAAVNPTNPAIPLALARLAASQNDLTTAETYTTQALTLKTNYTDAMLFVVQLSVAQNELQNAINAAFAAAQTAPGVAPIWFQLGLLLYTGGDTANAIAALEQAVILVPDYANAKYFLGLAYAASNRMPEAIRQFEEIQRSNPDNAEVQIILGNLRAGKQPFEGVQPPPTPPEERTQAPVSE